MFSKKSSSIKKLIDFRKRNNNGDKKYSALHRDRYNQSRSKTDWNPDKNLEKDPPTENKNDKADVEFQNSKKTNKLLKSLPAILEQKQTTNSTFTSHKSAAKSVRLGSSVSLPAVFTLEYDADHDNSSVNTEETGLSTPLLQPEQTMFFTQGSECDRFSLSPEPENEDERNENENHQRMQQNLPSPESVSSMDDIFIVVKAQVHRPPLKATDVKKSQELNPKPDYDSLPLLKENRGTLINEDANLGPGIPTTENTDQNTNETDFKNIHEDPDPPVVQNIETKVDLEQEPEPEVQVKTCNQNQEIQTESSHDSDLEEETEIDELKHLKEDDHLTASSYSSFGHLTLSPSPANVKGSVGSGSAKGATPFSNSKSKPSPNSRFYFPTYKSLKEDSQPQPFSPKWTSEERRKGTAAVKKSFKPSSKVVGYFENSDFATPKTANSMKIWLCDRPEDLLVIREDGSVVDPKLQKKKRKPLKDKNISKSPTEFPYSDSYSDSHSDNNKRKSSLRKFYSRFFPKKDKGSKTSINGTSPVPEEWATTSLDRRGIPGLGTGTVGSSSGAGVGLAPGVSSSSGSGSGSKSKSKNGLFLSLSSYDILHTTSQP